MPSPVTPSQFCAAVPSANADLCTRFSRFLSVIQYLCDLFSWMLASDGAISDTFTNELIAKIIPAGTIAYSVSSSMGAGWVSADGSEISRTTYATLFSAVGTRYGAGNGSTTFRLPDLRGRSTIGAGQGLIGGSLTNRAIETIYAGEETHTMLAAELVPHVHSFFTSISKNTEMGQGNVFGGWRQSVATDTGSTGTGTPFPVVHPCVIAFPFIKT